MRWIKEVFLNFRRSGFMSLISMGTIVITIGMLGGYYIVNESVEYFIKKVENKVEVVVFLSDGFDREKIDNVVLEEQKMDHIKSVKFVSKDDAIKEFSRDREMRAIIEGFEENPLPDSLVVKLKNYSKKGMDATVKYFKSKEGVEEVQYGAEEIENLLNIMNVVRMIIAAIGITFIVASLLVVSNIIKLTIYARRQDIYIFRMIGATGTFIRMPFIFEGIIHGFIGGLIGWGLLYGVIQVLIVEIKKEAGVDLSHFYLFKPYFMQVKLLLGAVVSGTVLGFLGSILSQDRV